MQVEGRRGDESKLEAKLRMFRLLSSVYLEAGGACLVCFLVLFFVSFLFSFFLTEKSLVNVCLLLPRTYLN